MLICMSCMWDACFTIHASASQLQNPDWGKRPHVKCLSFTCCQVEGHWDNQSQSKGLWGSLVTHHYSDLPQRAEGLLQLIKLLFILLCLTSSRVLPFSFIYTQAHHWICLIQRTEKQPSNKAHILSGNHMNNFHLDCLWIRYCPSTQGYDSLHLVLLYLKS